MNIYNMVEIEFILYKHISEIIRYTSVVLFIIGSNVNCLKKQPLRVQLSLLKIHF